METNKFVIGILAHVDSGKTTLAENMLYKSGSIKRLGRVDHKDAFFDYYDLERERGMTIFSKQAQLNIGNKEIFMLDTPGHVDFSAEMERTLQVLDYAILIISGADGIQGYTKTLWQLLEKHDIPVFIFVNKMDQPGTCRDRLLNELLDKLDASCVDFSRYMNPDKKFYEDIAMCDENSMEYFINHDKIEVGNIKDAVSRRKVFPCFFGSALKQQGVDEFMQALDYFMKAKVYPDEFGARVFKIAYDEKNNRLTYMKILGGTLKVKMMISNGTWSEKADQIRVYSGNRYKSQDEAAAGDICAVTGLSSTFSGEGLGIIKEHGVSFLEPVLNYRLIVPEEYNVYELYTKLCVFEEEDPQIHIIWNEQLNEIQMQVMGEIQTEILKDFISERFHFKVDFGTGNIIYKETIMEPVIGIGHFEPLRHYAEVHLLMEPLERGRGLEFLADCSEGMLDRAWQRLVLKHLEGKKHIGVLTGSEITDMKISVIAGRSHQKHTEGGDFRQAAYRAVRNGMKKAESILLEPFYEFQLEVPQEFIGRAMTDIRHMHGKFEMPVIENGMARLGGTAPVACMQGYQIKVSSYTGGNGHIFCTVKGYDICHNMDEVITGKRYDSESDVDNPTGSIFCVHGAGYHVEWDKVADYAHVINPSAEAEDNMHACGQMSRHIKKPESDFEDVAIGQEEINEVFERTFGSMKKKRAGWKKTVAPIKDNGSNGKEIAYQSVEKDKYLLIDGYNIIFAWEELRQLSEINIDSARNKLMDIMCNYQGYKKINIILVFDAYKVHGGQGKVFNYHNIHVVYTKEAETADQYIEKITNDIGKKYDVTVATSDRIEQMIVWGQGARRLSASELLGEIEQANRAVKDTIEKNKQESGRYGRGRYLLEDISENVNVVIKNIKKV